MSALKGRRLTRYRSVSPCRCTRLVLFSLRRGSFEQSFLSTASVTGSAAGTPGADSLPPLVSGFGDPASPLEKDGGVRVDSDTGLFQADSGSSFLAAVSIAAGGDVGVLPEQEQGM